MKLAIFSIFLTIGPLIIVPLRFAAYSPISDLLHDGFWLILCWIWNLLHALIFVWTSPQTCRKRSGGQSRFNRLKILIRWCRHRIHL